MNVPLNDCSIVILGAGSIGIAFAAVMSGAGAQVLLTDPDHKRRSMVHATLMQQRQAIATAGLASSAGGKVELSTTPDNHLSSASLVLECGPENLEVKQKIFAKLLQQTGPKTVLATASSAITISRIVPKPEEQARCLVAHPVNPPSILRVIELVPAAGTDQLTTIRAAQLFEAAGFTTVALGHEIEGFVLNRLQGAVLREAYRLIEEGVTDVAGIDAIMQLGLGPRWALSGPFETAELNTPGGITAHAARMGPAYKRMGESRGEIVDWNDELVARVAKERLELLRQEDIPARVAWRARAVARMVAVRDELLKESNND